MQKNFFFKFVGILKGNGENRRIRIHLSEAWIRGSGSESTPKCHGSAILIRSRIPPFQEDKYFLVENAPFVRLMILSRVREQKPTEMLEKKSEDYVPVGKL